MIRERTFFVNVRSLFDKKIRRVLKGKFCQWFLTPDIREVEGHKTEPSQNKDKTYRLWQYWDGGLANAPEIVKACISSVEKFKGDLEHVVLNNDTIKNYVENVKGVAFFTSNNDEIPFQMDIDTGVSENYDESSEEYRRYWGLSYAYGDTVYPGYVMTRPMRYALADTLSGISIITEKDFDAQHPAGSSINDILNLTVISDHDTVGYFDTETLAVKTTEMYIEGYKAFLVKDTSRKGLWTVSFTLKEF